MNSEDELFADEELAGLDTVLRDYVTRPTDPAPPTPRDGERASQLSLVNSGDADEALRRAQQDEIAAAATYDVACAAYEALVRTGGSESELAHAAATEDAACRAYRATRDVAERALGRRIDERAKLK